MVVTDGVMSVVWKGAMGNFVRKAGWVREEGE